MSSTIYVLTDGEYSDYHIVGVFSTREKAIEYKDKMRLTRAVVEGWALDAPLDLVAEGTYVSASAFVKIVSGNVSAFGCDTHGRKVTPPYRVFREVELLVMDPSFIRVKVDADDPDHAKKLIAEAWQEFLRLCEFEHLMPGEAVKVMNERFGV